MNFRLLLVVLVGALLMASNSILFIVDQRQSAIVFALGEVRRVIQEPGLYFKLPPPFQNVTYFDRRTLTLDNTDIDRFITAEKLNIQVDSYVKWRIADPRQFYVSVAGNELRAEDRIARQLRAAMNNEIARMTIEEVISTRRSELIRTLRENLDAEVSRIGVKVVDVRLKRVDFAPEVAERVYERMASERKRVANERRATGAAENEKLRADADRQREVVISEGYRDAQRIKGEGDARATEIFAEAFGKDPSFASFYRSLEAYRNSFNGSGRDMLVLDPTSDFFRYFGGSTGRMPAPGKEEAPLIRAVPPTTGALPSGGLPGDIATLPGGPAKAP